MKTRQRRAAQNHRNGNPQIVERLQVLFHDGHRLHQEPTHPDRTRVRGLQRIDDLLQRLLDADVVDRVSVVGQNDVDQVLADVMDIAGDRCKHDGASPGVSLDFLHERLKSGDRLLHDLRGLKNERKLHSTVTEEYPDHLHAFEQMLVDDVER